MIRVLLIPVLAVAIETAPTPLFAQSPQQGVAFIDDRPIPERKPDPKARAREKALRQQRKQIQQLIAKEEQTAQAAAQLSQDFKKQLARNAQDNQRLEAKLTAQEAKLANLRNRVSQKGQTKSSQTSKAIAKLRQNIKKLQGKQRKLRANLAQLRKERDNARTALAAGQRAIHKEEASNRALNVQLTTANKERREADRSQRAAQLATRHEEEKRRKLEQDLAKLAIARRNAERALSKARITITTLTGKLKTRGAPASPNTASITNPVPPAALAGSSGGATSSSSRAKAIALARQRALSAARKRAKAARSRTNQTTAPTN